MEQTNDEKLKDSVFFVEADSFSKSCLRKKYKDEVNWEFDDTGFLRQVGNIGKKTRQVTISFSFAKIFGKRICFYYPTSRFVDYYMIEKYIETNWPLKYDNNSRKSMCDAETFYEAINYCKSL